MGSAYRREGDGLELGGAGFYEAAYGGSQSLLSNSLFLFDLDAYGPGVVRVSGGPEHPVVWDPGAELVPDLVPSRRVAAAHSWLSIADAWRCRDDLEERWSARVALLVVNDLDDLYGEGGIRLRRGELRRVAATRSRVACRLLVSLGSTEGWGGGAA